jgi:flagellar biosynthetic protein FliR
MFILFSLIVLRITGALAFNSLWSRAEFSPRIRGIFIFALSTMIYIWIGGKLVHEPETLLEYGVMMLKELFVGFALGFGMDVSIMVIRFATSIMDFSMGLNMGQIYDPQTNSQATVTTNLFSIGIMLVFFTSNGALKFFQILLSTLDKIPFGNVQITTDLARFMLETFNANIILGLQFAFPIIGVELLTEVAIGIVMRVIPQINIFTLNFQLKIIIGMMMLLFLYNPLSDKLYFILNRMYSTMEEIIRLMS